MAMMVLCSQNQFEHNNNNRFVNTILKLTLNDY